jgi:hypothetical protein
MRISGFGRCALSSCVAVAILAGCGILPLSLSKGQDDMQPAIGAPGATPQSHTIARGQVSHRPGLTRGPHVARCSTSQIPWRTASRSIRIHD